jgi:hypothetical protein
MRLLALTCCARCDDPAAGTCAGTVAAVLWTLPPALLGTAYIYVCIFVEVDHSFGAEKTPFSEPDRLISHDQFTKTGSGQT